VERSNTIAAAASTSRALVGMMTYITQGELSADVAFHCEVAGELAEALRRILIIEQARMSKALTTTVTEQDALAKMQAAIAEFQKEFGHD
jgi:hypothetical protein